MNGPANPSAAAGAPGLAPVSQLSTPTSQPPSLPDYELLRRIGVGGYGEVWLARSTATGALRAVKFVRRATFADAKPFEREFAGLLKFEAVSRAHPSQLALFHVGRASDGSHFYYVMELADDAGQESGRVGKWESEKPAMAAPSHVSPAHSLTFSPATYAPRTLRSDLEAGRLPAARVLELGLALTEALAHLHGHGLVHRDLKPSNLIFVDGRPKLADIGLVTDASDSRSFVGTEGYLPPEGPGTPAADIFALGRVLYEALTGLDRRQFPELPADLRQWPDAALAFELNTILVRACAADARERYASAEAMLADLRLLDAGKSVKRRRSVQRGWSWTWKMAAVLALVSLSLVLIRNERDRRAALTRLNASPFEKSGTTNFAAWQAQQRGSLMGGVYNSFGSSNAVLEHERAVALDPNFVSGWITLSSKLFLSVFYGYIPGVPAMERARFGAQKAIELKPSSSGGWFMLAECNLALDYDFARAEPLFRKAIQLDPKFDMLRQNFGARLWYYGRFAEAEEMLQQTIRENPTPGYAHATLGQIYGATHRFPEALAALGDALRLEPSRPDAYSNRGELHWAMGRRAEAARDWQRFVELDGFASLGREDVGPLEKALGENGPEGFLRQLIELLEQRIARGQFVSAYDLARLHAFAGNKPRALDYLEQAVDEHRTYTLSAKVHLAFRDFQDEPRYHAVLRRLKLEQ